jgi:diaminohydroxyphosphoribosylaminopyrimidine deaminase/5-amino-6-(5-phosphoribosylamino)uracil reductase
MFPAKSLRNSTVLQISPAKYHATMTSSAKAPESHKDNGSHREAEARLQGITTGDFDQTWNSIARIFRDSDRPLPSPWQEIFGPLRDGSTDGLMVVGQFGQSIDARIATASGHSHYINGEAGLAHLHRLRALVDAVVVGVGTAIADDPQLTVRRVAGPCPARVVIDPNGRLPTSARMLADDGVRRLVITRETNHPALPGGVERIGVPAPGGQIAPASILAALAARGLRRFLIEGGADTMSRFLAAKCLDRLHIVIAPIIIGAGPSSVTLAPIARLDEAVRAPMRAHILGEEVLLDCDLTAQRIPIGVAKTSR